MSEATVLETPAVKTPGVIASIVDFLKEADEQNPLTKEDLLNKLCEAFPDRERDKMHTTVTVQVPNRLAVERKLLVKKVKGQGKRTAYWIETEKPNQEKSPKKKSKKKVKKQPAEQEIIVLQDDAQEQSSVA